jgi:predicted MFS family arabinose efflux permease
MESKPVVEQSDVNNTSNAYRNYVLFVLTLVYAFNFIDRQIIGILSPFIKADLGLDDAQLGWLKGLYFALLYTVLGIPIAWLADRYNRVNIVVISLTLWSGFTALSGMASSFSQLALARIGVGIGEAGGSPPSHSIISDLFPKEKRASALAIYSLGIPFGIMLAFFASAFFLKGGSTDWRVAMLAVGLPGIILAILLKITVREPIRTGNMQSQAGRTKSWSSIKTLLSIKSWWGMCFAISFGSFGNYAISTWMIDFYVRAHAGLDVTSLLISIGVINGTAYAGGAWWGGVLVDKLGKNNRGAYGYVPGFAMLIGAPAYFISLQVE